MTREEERLFKKKRKPFFERCSLKDALVMLGPFLGMIISAVEFVALPNVHPVVYVAKSWLPALAVCAIVYGIFFVASLFIRPLRLKVRHFSWLIFACRSSPRRTASSTS